MELMIKGAKLREVAGLNVGFIEWRDLMVGYTPTILFQHKSRCDAGCCLGTYYTDIPCRKE